MRVPGNSRKRCFWGLGRGGGRGRGCGRSIEIHATAETFLSLFCSDPTAVGVRNVNNCLVHPRTLLARGHRGPHCLTRPCRSVEPPSLCSGRSSTLPVAASGNLSLVTSDDEALVV